MHWYPDFKWYKYQVIARHVYREVAIYPCPNTWLIVEVNIPILRNIEQRTLPFLRRNTSLETTNARPVIIDLVINILLNGNQFKSCPAFYMSYGCPYNDWHLPCILVKQIVTPLYVRTGPLGHISSRSISDTHWSERPRGNKLPTPNALVTHSENSAVI